LFIELAVALYKVRKDRLVDNDEVQTQVRALPSYGSGDE
jgi:hypothetical protein